MSTLKDALQSQVGRKLITGITGLGLVLFIIIHLLGNLSYFAGPEAINTYSHTLHELGGILWIARIGLLVFFLYHAYMGLSIWLEKRRARPVGYHSYTSRGGPTRQTWGAKSMAFTGVVLFVFVIFHLNTFAFYDFQTVTHGGVEMHDVHARLTEVFQYEVYTFSYVLTMVLLGMHLRHGVWSSFQSLGWMSRNTNPVIYSIAYGVAVIVAVGFIGLPLSIYFGLV